MIAGRESDVDRSERTRSPRVDRTIWISKQRSHFQAGRPDIHRTIAGFDIFVSSSRSESFGYAIADAMLTGVPVVATETEGAKEIISDARSGCSSR